MGRKHDTWYNDTELNTSKEHTNILMANSTMTLGKTTLSIKLTKIDTQYKRQSA
jgi:hypothetical protein